MLNLERGHNGPVNKKKVKVIVTESRILGKQKRKRKT
jgi:hypothetical protein